ncbi:MAG: MBL fold metallo-hydrolase [Proteobacteria bacterium]|nr:MAG: MBL fold metallo-hydrolase [Pseudomonadota bacterium]
MDSKDYIKSGTLPDRWIHGSPKGVPNLDPAIEVHAYNEDFFILRQSKAAHFEAPFIYLICGLSRAVLFDTGALQTHAKFPLRQTVEEILLKRYGKARSQIDFIVSHTHAHGDHVAADSQFVGQPHTRLIGAKIPEFTSFYGLKNWPDETSIFDLGDRRLHLIPIPGHETTDLAIYDERTGIVLSGDTLYPGRLYITDWKRFKASVNRLHDYLSNKPVTYFLGSHIEMSKEPGIDYPAGTTYQPDEVPLQMEWADLLELRAALESIGDTPRRQVHPKFIITPTRGGGE